MSLFVECKPDETLAFTLGVPLRQIEHASGKSGVCGQLARRSGVTGMVDGDPGSVVHPYVRTLEQVSWEHGVRVRMDKKRENRLVEVSPRLEEWLVEAARSAGIKLTDYGFQSDNGVHLHAEINQRLKSLKKLVEALLAAESVHLFRLQLLVKQT